jgi:hypothetical protein
MINNIYSTGYWASPFAIYPEVLEFRDGLKKIPKELRVCSVDKAHLRSFLRINPLTKDPSDFLCAICYYKALTTLRSTKGCSNDPSHTGTLIRNLASKNQDEFLCRRCYEAGCRQLQVDQGIKCNRNVSHKGYFRQNPLDPSEWLCRRCIRRVLAAAEKEKLNAPSH